MNLRLSHACLVLLAVAACDPPTSIEPSFQLDVRAPKRGTLVIDGRAVALRADQRTVVGGLGPPPWTATFMTEGAQLTVVDVTADGLDLVRLLGAPDGRPGNLVQLPIQRDVDDDLQLIAIVNGRVIPAIGDVIGLPAEESADLWGLWHRDGQVTGLTYRRLGRAAAWSNGLSLGPSIPVDGRTDIQLPRTPAGWAKAELTIDGLRTGLILGEGLVSARSAVRIRRPLSAVVPGGGLWISARAPTAELDVHLPLDTPEAGLIWADDAEISPRPGAVDAGALLGRERPLRWAGGNDGLIHAQFDTSDGCSTQRWDIIAPGDSDPFDLPVPPGADPLALPFLSGSIAVDVMGDVPYRDRLSGALGPAQSLPRRTSRRALRRVIGTWRGGLSACEPSAAQGTWFVYPMQDDAQDCAAGDTAPTIIIDRCGAVIPQPADPDLCGKIEDRTVALRAGGRLPLIAEDEGWRIGTRWRLVAPAAAQAIAPAELVGDWHRARVSEQPRMRGNADGPGPATQSALVLASGAPEDGPWAQISDAGRLTITLDRRPMQAILLGYDGSEARFAIDGGACLAQPREATGRINADGALVIEEWLPEAGILRTWTLDRQ